MSTTVEKSLYNRHLIITMQHFVLLLLYIGLDLTCLTCQFGLKQYTYIAEGRRPHRPGAIARPPTGRDLRYHHVIRCTSSSYRHSRPLLYIAKFPTLPLAVITFLVRDICSV